MEEKDKIIKYPLWWFGIIMLVMLIGLNYFLFKHYVWEFNQFVADMDKGQAINFYQVGLKKFAWYIGFNFLILLAMFLGVTYKLKVAIKWIRDN
ncbi:hypothetical protein NBRC116188_23700 [Oceaniserpentilla sp. 4NH20-0058]|uniref:hypothetical protein n=1 Tax=Oceaniserpentilla sp. 4NH20-0058 TaxID=3127660 RepID=UPI0031044C6E